SRAGGGPCVLSCRSRRPRGLGPWSPPPVRPAPRGPPVRLGPPGRRDLRVPPVRQALQGLTPPSPDRPDRRALRGHRAPRDRLGGILFFPAPQALQAPTATQ